MTGFIARAVRRRPVCLALALLGLTFASPGFAQPTSQEITVFGRRLAPGEPQELKRAVSYRDLDLSTAAGAAEFRKRVDDTAMALCRQLGEPPAAEQNTAVLPSCQDAAKGSAAWDVRKAIGMARARTAAR